MTSAFGFPNIPCNSSPSMPTKQLLPLSHWLYRFWTSCHHVWLFVLFKIFMLMLFFYNLIYRQIYFNNNLFILWFAKIIQIKRMVKDDTQKSKNNIVHGTEGVELSRESSRPDTWSTWWHGWIHHSPRSSFAESSNSDIDFAIYILDPNSLSRNVSVLK